MASAFSDPLAPSPCDQCGNASEGTMRCSVRDSKNLCQDCFHDLPQARREDIGDPEWVCNIHLNHKVDTFCKTCHLGCCKECAVDVHEGHKVVNVFKLVEEIRCDLTEQLQEVGVREERLFELRRTIEYSSRIIEEVPKLFDKFIDETKEEVAQNLEKEVHRIQWETQVNILHQERRRDNMLELAIEKADLHIQRIEELQRGISTGLLEDAEKMKFKIQKAESKLLVGQQACESANLEITCLLESTPEKLACGGRRLGSLVKASLAFQCQNEVLDCCRDALDCCRENVLDSCREDVLDSCREDEADPPKVKVEKDNFCYGSGPFSPLVKIMLYIFAVFYFANEARGDYRDKYNILLSSESITDFICLSFFFPILHAMKCFVLTLLLACDMYNYPITRKESFMKKLKSCIKMVQLCFEFWDETVSFLILVSSLLYCFQVKSVSANIISIMSILQSCSFLKNMRTSKTLKELLSLSEAL